MKSFIVWLDFHWSLFQVVLMTISQYCWGNGLAPNRQQPITWTKLTQFTDEYMQHYVGDELSDKLKIHYGAVQYNIMLDTLQCLR